MSLHRGLAALLLSASAWLPACDESTAPDDDGGEVQLVDSFTLPVAELSSITLRTTGDQQEVCGVGDGSTFIVVADVGADGALGDAQKVEVSGLLGDDVQWEGVASDGAGNLFVLQESGRVLVLNPALDELLALIDLPASSGSSGVEGLVLLANGHLLVAHEKDPVSLIELGPAGSTSEGIDASQFLPASFPLPSDNAFVGLAAWSLELDDVSDLAVFNGRLFVVSDEERAIVEVELPLGSGSDAAALRTRWPLPAEVDKPEGLVFVGGAPIVAADRPEGDPNTFLLTALE